jgi:sterol desaturase/sphingolipid hydroxylase (fatty acid hydroxylase superfamily)
MEKYWNIVQYSFSGYWDYLVSEISHPSLNNYFYWLVILSLLAWALEIVIPWRKKQSIVRKDFWLDGFYMFFNFFIFSLIGYNAISNVGVELFNDFLGWIGIDNLVALEISSWPEWLQLMTLFIIADFIQWNVHRMLHHVPWLWEFHKLHHSVKEMGFAAHLRFHWMETIFYKTIQYVPLTMIGFGIQDFFVVHIITLFIGHLNHANLNWNYGYFRYILNNPRMHIWHHAKNWPQNYPFAANYGISLSLWDYLFGTVYLPSSGRDVELGFEEDEIYPTSFFKQILYPLSRKK